MFVRTKKLEKWLSGNNKAIEERIYSHEQLTAKLVAHLQRQVDELKSANTVRVKNVGKRSLKAGEPVQIVPNLSKIIQTANKKVTKKAVKKVGK